MGAFDLFMRPLLSIALAAVFALAPACKKGGESRAANAPSAPRTLRVMPLGDSITEGADGAATYRFFLQRQLEGAGIRVDFVGSRSGVFRGSPRFADFDADHEGHWGWTTGQILDRIDEWAPASRPDAVLVHLGTNDLGRDPSIIPRNLSAIIDELRRANPDVAVFLARLIPLAGYPRDRLEAVNDSIAALAAEKSTARSAVESVAQDDGFDAAADTYDGAHPNESGERKIAEKWFRALAAWRSRVAK